jgi:putative DNA primase/helicase
MNAQEVASRFSHARRSGKEWIARCPAHADKNPSLSIREADGKILLHCHAGCTVESICRGAGIEVSDLFLEQHATARVIAQYDYTDERSKLLYVVERLEPKGFRQKRPDGHGGWIWNLNAVRRVLYRLPEVLSAKSVLMAEGEKDCDTARKLGLVATCNPGGAGKWREEYSECLRGKRIAIIADADESGRKHSQQVATSLAGKVETLKVLELPGAKDLSEWVASGGIREDLLELIKSAPNWAPSKTGTVNGFVLTRLADLLAKPDMPVDYLLEDRLVAGTVSGVFAKPKVGKSTFARNLCLAVSRGEDFLGLKTKHGECIYLALEEREEEVRGDFRAMGADGSETILIHAATAPVEGIRALCDLIRERRPVLVVVDPLFRLAHIRDEKAYAETYAALGPLIDVARIAGTHVHLTHHAGKSIKVDAIDSPLGSTALGGAVSTVLVMRRTEAYRTLQSVQRIGPDMPESVLKFDLDSRRLTLDGSRFEADRRECEDAILAFLRDADGPQTQAQIRDSVEGQTTVIRAALTALATSGNISKSGEGTRGKPFLYEFPNSGSQHISGTRKPESENSAQVLSNVEEILVPENSQETIVVRGNDDGEIKL